MGNNLAAVPLGRTALPSKASRANAKPFSGSLRSQAPHRGRLRCPLMATPPGDTPRHPARQHQDWGPAPCPDEDLLGTLRPLIPTLCSQMKAEMHGSEQTATGSGKAAVHALAAAEHAGAIPVLTGREREAMRGALARSAAAIQTQDEEWLCPGSVSEEDEDDVMGSITPLAFEVFAAMAEQEQAHGKEGGST